MSLEKFISAIERIVDTEPTTDNAYDLMREYYFTRVNAEAVHEWVALMLTGDDKSSALSGLMCVLVWDEINRAVMTNYYTQALNIMRGAFTPSILKQRKRIRAVMALLPLPIAEEIAPHVLPR